VGGGSWRMSKGGACRAHSNIGLVGSESRLPLMFRGFPPPTFSCGQVHDPHVSFTHYSQRPHAIPPQVYTHFINKVSASSSTAPPRMLHKCCRHMR
jgi:hypothetical protein